MRTVRYILLGLLGGTILGCLTAEAYVRILMHGVTGSYRMKGLP